MLSQFESSGFVSQGFDKLAYAVAGQRVIIDNRDLAGLTEHRIASIKLDAPEIARRKRKSRELTSPARIERVPAKNAGRPPPAQSKSTSKK
jgi:hypothetical protein